MHSVCNQSLEQPIFLLVLTTLSLFYGLEVNGATLEACVILFVFMTYLQTIVDSTVLNCIIEWLAGTYVFLTFCALQALATLRVVHPPADYYWDSVSPAKLEMLILRFWRFRDVIYRLQHVPEHFGNVRSLVVPFRQFIGDIPRFRLQEYLVQGDIYQDRKYFQK